MTQISGVHTSADCEGLALVDGMAGAKFVRQQDAKNLTCALGDFSSGSSWAMMWPESATRRLMSLLPGAKTGTLIFISAPRLSKIAIPCM